MHESEHAAAADAGVRFGGTTPILRVDDLDASLAFYTGQLGFAEEWRAGGFASVGRGRATLMLCEGDQGQAGTWVYVGVSDADALHAEFRGRGVAIRQPPTNYPWGAREMQVCDPDHHVLRFGSDALPGEPIGDWVDGSGTRWRPQPDGSWHLVDDSPSNPMDTDRSGSAAS
ncbi:MAG TPA: VOC family protein [Longimicrobiaceae bacterium]|nr:VOC family protein [Longimicrobiaceae bacterium]